MAPDPLPMAELHCHLEGTVKPALARTLAARHGVDLTGIFDDHGNYRWRTFADFIRVYDAMSEAVRTPEDYIDITRAYLEEGAAQGLRYSELFVSPFHARRCGISYTTLIDAIAEAIGDARRRLGVHARLIATCVRHLGTDHAEDIARLAERHPHPLVVGFGMGGDENHGRPKDYARAYAIAHGAGLHVTAHAGELAGADSVRAAIDDLPITRVGHGVRAHEDPALLPELAARAITLELCPGSNLALGLFGSMREHPIKAYLDAGLIVTISSDDPPFFHTDIRREYDHVAHVHGLSAEDMLDITRNAVRSAFCDDDLKKTLLADIDAWQKAAPGV